MVTIGVDASPSRVSNGQRDTPGGSLNSLDEQQLEDTVVNQANAGVLVSEDQHSEAGRKNFDNLVTLVARGEVDGRIIESLATASSGTSSQEARLIRRGVKRGAMAGFLLGLVPLTAMTLMAAVAGGLIAKATLLRIEKGTAPRLRFARYDE